MGAALESPLQELGDHGVPLGPLDEGSAVRLVEALRPLLLHRDQSVGLARTADAAGLAGHDLHQVEVLPARLDIVQQLLGIHQAVDHGDPQGPVPHRQRHGPDGLAAPDAGELDGLEGVLGLVLHHPPGHGLRHAAGGAEDGGRAGAHAEGQVRGLPLQLREADAGLLDHVDDLLGGQHQIHVRFSVMLELRPLGLHLLGGAGHDGDVIGGPPVLRVLLGVLVLQHGGKHLHGGLAGGDVLQEVGPLFLHVLHPRRTAAGEHGEGAALLQPLQELVRLLHDGQVRAEGGVVHLVGAHHLQGGHQLVDGVDAGLQAEGLAHRHPDRRGDLEHHPLLGVVKGSPAPADLIEDGDGAGGAGGGALAAADAVGLTEFPVKGRHYL